MVSVLFDDDFGIGVVPDGLDSLLGVGLCGVSLGCEEVLSVVCAEPEPELPRLVEVDLPFGVLELLVVLKGLILDV